MGQCEILDSTAFHERFQAQAEFTRRGFAAPWAPGWDTQRQAGVLLQRVPWWEGPRTRGRFSFSIGDTLLEVGRLDHPGLARPVAAAETPEGLTHAVEWDGVRTLEDVLCEIADPQERVRLAAARVAEVVDVARVLHENGVRHFNVFGSSMGVASDGTARLSGAVGVVVQDAHLSRPPERRPVITDLNMFTAGDVLGAKCGLVGPALFLYELFTGVEPYPHGRALLTTHPLPREINDSNPAVPPVLAERIMRLVCSWRKIADVDIADELEALRSDLAALGEVPSGGAGPHPAWEADRA